MHSTKWPKTHANINIKLQSADGMKLAWKSHWLRTITVSGTSLSCTLCDYVRFFSRACRTHYTTHLPTHLQSLSLSLSLSLYIYTPSPSLPLSHSSSPFLPPSLSLPSSLSVCLIPIHTHTHKWTNREVQGVASSGHPPARAGAPCATFEELLGSTGQILEVIPSTRTNTDLCLPAMVWAPKVPPVPWRSMAQSVVLSIPSLSQVPSLLFSWAWVGAK